MTDVSVADHLRLLLSDRDATGEHVRRYFTDQPETGTTYTGRWFERLGGGGDSGDVRNTVTATDIVAVSTLSVTIPPEVAADLLEGNLAGQLNDLFRQIPTTIDLWSDEAGQYVDTEVSPAWQAWSLLVARRGIGAVKASKLLARKRPRLLPVYDKVVRCTLGRPHNSWQAIRSALSDNADLVPALDELRHEFAPTNVSALRVLDVAAWMAHRNAHRNRNCPGLT